MWPALSDFLVNSDTYTRKMSDSESDQPLVASRPSDSDLTGALRDVVGGIFASGNMDELTVKRVRLAAEKKLGIEEGFFKRDGEWKTRSDQVIKDEVVRGFGFTCH